MRYRYDRQTDILIIELKRQKPDFAEQAGNIITHYDKQSRPVEIEILGASRATRQMLKAMGKGALAKA